MAAEVYFYPIHSSDTNVSVAEALAVLMQAACVDDIVHAKDLCALKLHFGEDKNDTHIKPEWIRPIVDLAKKNGANPFLTDTCVLYKSRRDNAVEHLRLAHDHGFTLERTGAPVIIADGLLGGSEYEVEISGEIFKKVAVAELAHQSNSMFVITHVTGHMLSGMGAAIKNLGMGFASRKGKLLQHATMKPKIKTKFCTKCNECIKWCPENAIVMGTAGAAINQKLCIGCGECITVCRFSAVKHDWGMTAPDIQKRMAEHALGVIYGKEGRVAYISFLLNITRDCDCMDKVQDVCMTDIGILVGYDPVAIDAATLDLLEKNANKSLDDVLYAEIDARIQMKHGEKIGLGEMPYELISVA
ncbi:DUF362 domain-containing protein [bacterium]|nr:DUF362 domain-containing protein [bacterium]